MRWPRYVALTVAIVAGIVVGPIVVFWLALFLWPTQGPRPIDLPTPVSSSP